MSSRHTIHVELHGDHAHVGLGTLPPSARPVVVAALAQHLGFELVELEKAGSGEGPDPRFPEIAVLLERMRDRWSWWTRWLVDRLLGAGRGPQTQTQAHAVLEILRLHEAGVVADTTGANTDPPAVAAHVAAGDLPASYALTAPIPQAFALGRALDADKPPRVPPKPEEHRPPIAVLSDQDLASVAYARDRAAVYMRRPVTTQQQAAQQSLLDAQIRISPWPDTGAVIRETIVQAVADRVAAPELARRLRDAVQDPTITNDFDRVAVTELAAAHNHGAYVALRAGLESGEDPLVYKIASPAACAACRRIWGDPSNPLHYRLSAVEKFSAAGGNFRRPSAEWGPTIGPTHPRCVCPPLLRWHPEVHDAVLDVAAELRAVYGGR